MTEPLDSTNFDYDRISINKFLKYGQAKQGDIEKINTIFTACDTEDEKGQPLAKGDGKLNKNEWTKFCETVKMRLPEFVKKFEEFDFIVEIAKQNSK